MADVCVQCKTWRQEQYWNAFPDNKHHFFKIMVRDFRKFLRIPPKFKSEFKGKLSEKVILRGPSGNRWTTTLARRGEDFVLLEGWQNFAKDHGLHEGDFLVFKYSEDSLFDVLIFDKTACEREDSHFIEPNAAKCCSSSDNIESQKSTTSDEGQNITIPVKQTRKRRQKSAAAIDQQRLKHQQKKRTNEKQLCKEEEEEEEEEDVDVEESNDDNSGKELITSGSQTRECKKVGKRTYSMYFESSRRTVTNKDIERAFHLASKHATKQPSCQISMKPSHVEHLFILTIPKNFAYSCLPKESQKIILRVGSETWPVLLNYRNTQCTLNKGWSQFVLDNNLETEDICVLELAHTKMKSQQPLTLDVHIFRAVEKIVPLKVIKPFQPL